MCQQNSLETLYVFNVTTTILRHGYSKHFLITVISSNLVSVFFKYKPEEKKEEILLGPMAKAHTPAEMPQGQSDNTNNEKKKFD